MYVLCLCVCFVHVLCACVCVVFVYLMCCVTLMCLCIRFICVCFVFVFVPPCSRTCWRWGVWATHFVQKRICQNSESSSSQPDIQSYPCISFRQAPFWKVVRSLPKTVTVRHFFLTQYTPSVFWHCQIERKSAQTILASILTTSHHC